MDIYHIWADLKDGEDAKSFASSVNAWLGRLQEHDHIAGFRMMRRKLGLAPDGASEFHIMVETDNLTQLDAAFQHAIGGEDDALHAAVYRAVKSVRFGLYRDWPDSL